MVYTAWKVLFESKNVLNYILTPWKYVFLFNGICVHTLCTSQQIFIDHTFQLPAVKSMISQPEIPQNRENIAVRLKVTGDVPAPFFSIGFQ